MTVVGQDIVDAAGKTGNLQEVFGLPADTDTADAEYLRQLAFAVEIANKEISVRLGREFDVANLDQADARNVVINGARIAVLVAKQQNTTITAEEQEEIDELRNQLDNMRKGPHFTGNATPVRITDRGGSVGEPIGRLKGFLI